MKNIVLFGAPGAGKGTQAAKLKEKYSLNHISTGEVIRAEIAAETELGKSMKDYISRGELAPDALVIDIIADYVKSHSDCAGNIFDGFPRTTAQAEAFDKIMARDGMKVDVMLELVVPEEELVKRLMLRPNRCCSRVLQSPRQVRCNRRYRHYRRDFRPSVRCNRRNRVALLIK